MKKIIRTQNAGVFYGKIESLDDATRVAVIRDARRVWRWDGAASLSQLAQEGTSKPDGCKFPCTVDRIKVYEVIEVLDMTDKAIASLDAVPLWEA